MSAGETSLPAEQQKELAVEAAVAAPLGRWGRLEAFLERASEWLSPILVKEARQAVKSKQFVMTFSLLLLVGWGWSLLGVALMESNAGFGPSGPAMLLGYYWILSFALGVIVPFSTFRSLASEREDGTYELLSITTLPARQIIGGKLGSSVLQMLVYLSALSPCIAFTYLLRGIDIFTICIFLGYTVAVSLLLCVIGLLLATVTRARHWQMVLSVGFILGLALLWWAVGANITDSMPYGMMYLPFDDPVFWVVQGAILTAMASYFVLIFFAAAARITFASENRSTRLRLIMLAMQMLLIGWVTWFFLHFEEHDVMMGGIVIGALHWSVMGALMIGETPEISQRVARQLPQSFLGRIFLTWLNPGPGAGYFFCLLNMLVLLTMIFIGDNIARMNGWMGYTHPLMFGFVVICQMAFYLGAARLCTAVARLVSNVTPFTSLLFVVLMLLAGNCIPLVLQFSFTRERDFTPLQATTFWAMSEAIEGNLNDTLTPILLCILGGGMLALNFPLTALEVRHRRQQAPRRVQADDALLKPISEKSSRDPFDDDA